MGERFSILKNKKSPPPYIKLILTKKNLYLKLITFSLWREENDLHAAHISEENIFVRFFLIGSYLTPRLHS